MSGEAMGDELPPGCLQLEVADIDHGLGGLMGITLQGAALADVGVCRPGAWTRIFVPGRHRDQSRVYSIRHLDRARWQLQLQIMRRRHGGHLSDWLIERLRPGDTLHLNGPKGGSEPALDVDWHLMLGDETALAAITSRLESLPSSMPVEAWIEAPRPAAQYPQAPHLHWLYRDASEDDACSRLWSVLRDRPPPQGRGELWIAGESGLVRDLEQWCRTHWTGCDVTIRAIGYWQVPGGSGAGI